MKEFLRNAKTWASATIHKYFGKIEHFAHCAYFGAAALGAHDLYAMIAGFLVVLMAIAWLTHTEF